MCFHLPDSDALSSLRATKQPVLPQPCRGPRRFLPLRPPHPRCRRDKGWAPPSVGLQDTRRLAGPLVPPELWQIQTSPPFLLQETGRGPWSARFSGGSGVRFRPGFSRMPLPTARITYDCDQGRGAKPDAHAGQAQLEKGRTAQLHRRANTQAPSLPLPLGQPAVSVPPSGGRPPSDQAKLRLSKMGLSGPD